MFRIAEVPPTLESYRAQPAAPNRPVGGSRPADRDASKPLVSVVTIVWNGARTLERAIDSVRAQSYPHIEHIIVDGGSTDGTLDILRRRDADVARWISEKDRGISDAFNKGVALASGEIVGILNCDDRYAREAVRRSVGALASDPGAGFSFGDCAFFDGPHPVRTLKGDARYARTIERSMPQLNHPTVFVRRSVYERVGLFRRHFRIAMDYDFLLRVHRAGIRGVYVPAIITEMDLGGVSNQRVLKGYRECLEAALDQGVPPSPALARFATGAIGHLGKRALQRVGANGVIARLEKLRYSVAE